MPLPQWENCEAGGEDGGHGSSIKAGNGGSRTGPGATSSVGAIGKQPQQYQSPCSELTGNGRTRKRIIAASTSNTTEQATLLTHAGLDTQLLPKHISLRLPWRRAPIALAPDNCRAASAGSVMAAVCSKSAALRSETKPEERHSAASDTCWRRLTALRYWLHFVQARQANRAGMFCFLDVIPHQPILKPNGLPLR